MKTPTLDDPLSYYSNSLSRHNLNAVCVFPIGNQSQSSDIDCTRQRADTRGNEYADDLDFLLKAFLGQWILMLLPYQWMRRSIWPSSTSMTHSDELALSVLE